MADSVWGVTDDYIAILQGQSIADAYRMGGLKAQLRGSQEHIKALEDHLAVFRDGFEKVRTALDGMVANAQRWTLDDFAMRAVLRELLQSIRMAAPNHPFLQASVRDRIYGTAHRIRMESIQNEPIKPGILELRQFAPNLAHQAALEILVSGATLILKELDPTHRLLDIENQQLLYWEHYEVASNENPTLTKYPAVNRLNQAYPHADLVDANRRYKRKHASKESVGKKDKAVAEIFGPLLGLKDAKKLQHGQ